MSENLTAQVKKLSSSLSRRLSGLGFGISGKYFIVKVIPQGEDDIGYTRRGNFIYVSFDNKYLDSLETIEERIAFIKGVFLHELMHQIETDFDTWERIKSSIKDPIQQRIFHVLANVIEDPSIEWHARYYMRDYALENLYFTLSTTYKMSPEIDPNDTPFEQFMDALIHYGDGGIIKGKVCPETNHYLNVALPLVDKAIEEDSGAKRIHIAKEIFDLTRPLWEEDAKNAEAMTKMLEEMMKQFGKAMAESSGEGLSKEDLQISGPNGSNGNPSNKKQTNTEKESEKMTKRRKVTYHKVSKEEMKQLRQNASQSSSKDDGSGDLHVYYCDEDEGQDEGKNGNGSGKNQNKPDDGQTPQNQNQGFGSGKPDSNREKDPKNGSGSGNGEQKDGDPEKRDGAGGGDGDGDDKNGKDQDGLSPNPTAQSGASDSKDGKESDEDGSGAGSGKKSDDPNKDGDSDGSGKSGDGEKKVDGTEDQSSENGEADSGQNKNESADGNMTGRSSKMGDSKDTARSTASPSKDYNPDEVDYEWHPNHDGNPEGSNRDLRINYDNAGQDQSDSIEPDEENVFDDEEFCLSEEEMESIAAEVESMKDEIELEKRNAEDLEAEDLDIDIGCPEYAHAKCLNVRDKTVPSDSLIASYQSIVQNYSTQIKGLVNQLRRIFMSDTEERMYKDSGRLNIKRLSSSRLTSYVFTKNLDPANKSNMAVFILVDNSGSMGGLKILQARNCTIALTEVFTALHIPVKVMGFTNDEHNGYGAFHHHFVNWSKELNERVKLLNMKALNSNFDGYSIRYATKALMKRNEQNKLLIVISDGQPNSRFYKGMDGISDTSNAIRKAKRACAVIGVGIDADINVLHTMYGEGFVLANQLDEMFNAIAQKIRRELKK